MYIAIRCESIMKATRYGRPTHTQTRTTPPMNPPTRDLLGPQRLLPLPLHACAGDLPLEGLVGGGVLQREVEVVEEEGCEHQAHHARQRQHAAERAFVRQEVLLCMRVCAIICPSRIRQTEPSRPSGSRSGPETDPPYLHHDGGRALNGLPRAWAYERGAQQLLVLHLFSKELEEARGPVEEGNDVQLYREGGEGGVSRERRAVGVCISRR